MSVEQAIHELQEQLKCPGQQAMHQELSALRSVVRAEDLEERIGVWKTAGKSCLRRKLPKHQPSPEKKMTAQEGHQDMQE